MSHYETYCLNCGEVQLDPYPFVCAVCGGLLGFRYDDASVRWDERFARSMWRYWRLLPVGNIDDLVHLDEGGTPLLPSRTFADARVWLKDETRNPTGSHKDRPLSVAVNNARAIGAPTSFVVSTGSTGISNAAFAARAGLRSVVIMPTGTPDERVYPMFALGSDIVRIEGAIDEVIDDVIRLCRSAGLYLSSTSHSSNPYQAEGCKTIAYELQEQLGSVPEWIVVPVGGGGTLSAIWRGYQDLLRLGHISQTPKMVGVLPEHYNALEVAFVRGFTDWESVLDLPYDNPPPSILVKLAHSYPPDGMEAIEAVRASGGHFIPVSDVESLAAQTELAHGDGLYVEPSTGACVAGVKKLLSGSLVRGDDTIIALISGSGFRETFVTAEMRPLRSQVVAADQLGEVLIAANRPAD